MRFGTLRLLAVLAALCAGCATRTGPAGAESATAPAPAGYRLAWSDEFDGAGLDKGKWSHRYPGPRNSSVNVPDAVSVADGHLTLIAYTEGGEHRTGMLTTEGKFERKFGYWEARIRFVGAPGMWSAFWIQRPGTPKPVGDPAVEGTEIDVIEHRVRDWHNTDISAVPAHALHYLDKSGETISQGHKPEDVKIGSGFHVYAVEWTETEYRFFIDGKMTWKATPVSKRPQYIVLSTEVRAKSWAGDIPAEGYGPRENSRARMIVDYVRFYEPDPAAVAGP